MTPPGTVKGWCPRSRVAGDRFVFELTLDRWPDALESPAVNYVVIQRWRRNGTDPPQRATVDVRVTNGDDDGVRTCRDSA